MGVLAMELRLRSGGDCTEAWHATIPSLQSKYTGTFLGAAKSVEEEASRAVFNSPSSGLSRSTTDACSICLVKPHCVTDGNVGAVATDLVQKGFGIPGIRLLTLTKKQAIEFLS